MLVKWNEMIESFIFPANIKILYVTCNKVFSYFNYEYYQESEAIDAEALNVIKISPLKWFQIRFNWRIDGAQSHKFNKYFKVWFL